MLDMASQTHMPAPVCLIENTEGQLKVNPDALRILSAITQPVVVVAIVGLYRTGKSYLMNKLAGKKRGFSLRSTLPAHTKGIWMWCLPHPKKPNQTLVLLDTEGLGDAEKNDSWIFTLAILLSSIFVYNSMGIINQQARDQLYYFRELKGLIRAKSSSDTDEVEDSAGFMSFFPDFVGTLRNFPQELELDRQSIFADAYPKHVLKLKQGTSQREKNSNLSRLCIQKFFPQKKFFVFSRPGEEKMLHKILKLLLSDELDSEFRQQVTEFCSYIFSSSRIKTLPGNIMVDGPRLQSLVLHYVDAISTGDLPYMENIASALAPKENSAAVREALAHYDQQMVQKVQLPTDTLQELLDLHRACEREAIEIFFKHSFKDVDQGSQKELVAQLEKRMEDFEKENLEASSKHCSALLQDIFSPLEEEVNQGIYNKPGGYRLFIQRVEDLKKEYYQKPRKGPQAEELLQKCLQSTEEMTNAILQRDRTLTENEKKDEVERVKAESAEAAAKMLEEMQKKNQEMLEQKEKNDQERKKQLADKMEEEKIKIKKGRDRVLALKLQEQVKLLEEGFDQESEQLQKEINHLKNSTKDASDGCVKL